MGEEWPGVPPCFPHAARDSQPRVGHAGLTFPHAFPRLNIPSDELVF